MMHPVANKPMLLCGQTLGFLMARMGVLDVDGAPPSHMLIASTH